MSPSGAEVFVRFLPRPAMSQRRYLFLFCHAAEKEPKRGRQGGVSIPPLGTPATTKEGPRPLPLILPKRRRTLVLRFGRKTLDGLERVAYSARQFGFSLTERERRDVLRIRHAARSFCLPVAYRPKGVWGKRWGPPVPSFWYSFWACRKSTNIFVPRHTARRGKRNTLPLLTSQRPSAE